MIWLGIMKNMIVPISGPPFHYEFNSKYFWTNIVFVLLNFLSFYFRIVLNINEFNELIWKEEDDQCEVSHNLWAYIVGAISHLLITVNSGANFFIYCFMSTAFRRILIGYVKKVNNHIPNQWVRKPLPLFYVCIFQNYILIIKLFISKMPKKMIG